MRRRGLAVGPLGVTLLLLPAAAVGQRAAPGDTVSLDSLMVTVYRSPAAIGRVPYPISVVGPAALQRGTTGTSLEEVLRAVPGLQVQNRFNPAVGERLAMRGFGARAQFGVRGLKVLVDGIPATLPDGQATLDHIDPGALGRVEVVRGPASALYGNAAGGVITFETAPAPEGTAAQGGVVAGAYGTRRWEAGASFGSSASGVRLNVARTTSDGFRADPDRPAERYGSSERTVLSGRAEHRLLGGDLVWSLNVLDLGAENPGAVDRAALDAGARPARGFNIVQGARKDVRQGQVGAQWTGAVGGLQARAAAWGITRDLDNPIVPRVIDLDRRAWGARALVARSYTTRTGVVTWLAGLEWEVQRDDRRNFENDMGRPGALTLDQLERVRALGAFAQVRAPFNDRVWLQGGVRYDRTTFRVDDRLGAGQGALSRALDALSPTAGLHVAPGGGFEFRAAVATSFETPTTTELVNRPDGGGGFNPDLDPTRGVSLEVGAAWAGAAGRARAEVSAWTTDLEDELVPFEDAAQPGRTFFRNAGASTYRGVEATASADPAGWLHMQAAYTFVDAVFDRYELDGTDLAGNRVPGVSRHRLDVRARGTARGAWIEFRTLAVGAVPVDDGNREAAPGYVLLDLRAGTAPLRVGAATLEPFVALDNLTDRAYAAAVTVNAFGGRYYEPGPGRSFFAGLRIRF